MRVFFLNHFEKLQKLTGVPRNKAMVMKFEKIGFLKVQSGRGRKSVAQDTVEEVATVIVDRAQSNIACTSSARGVFSEHGHAIQYNMEKLSKDYTFYPYKINHLQQFTLH